MRKKRTIFVDGTTQMSTEARRHREKKTKKRGFIKSEIAESIGPKAIGGFGNIRFDKTVCNYFLPLSLLRKKYARLSNLANKYLLFKMFTEENNIILPRNRYSDC